MKAQAHLEKARRLLYSLSRLSPDDDPEAVIELAFLAAHHLIAFRVDQLFGYHEDHHGRLLSQLHREKLFHIADLFQELGQIRHGSIYGRRVDGERARRALSILSEIRAWSVR